MWCVNIWFMKECAKCYNCEHGSAMEKKGKISRTMLPHALFTTDSIFWPKTIVIMIMTYNTSFHLSARHCAIHFTWTMFISSWEQVSPAIFPFCTLGNKEMKQYSKGTGQGLALPQNDCSVSVSILHSHNTTVSADLRAGSVLKQD
jgi:hypothetical protein